MRSIRVGEEINCVDGAGTGAGSGAENGAGSGAETGAGSGAGMAEEAAKPDMRFQ